MRRTILAAAALLALQALAFAQELPPAEPFNPGPGWTMHESYPGGPRVWGSTHFAYSPSYALPRVVVPGVRAPYHGGRSFYAPRRFRF